MDNWLKALVAAACLVIIMSGGYFALSLYTEWEAAKTMKAQIAQAEKRERCIAYKSNGRPLGDESDTLVRLKLTICQKEFPELF